MAVTVSAAPKTKHGSPPARTPAQGDGRSRMSGLKARITATRPTP